MRVDGYGQTWQVEDDQSLEAALAYRDDRGGGVFWLRPDGETYPALAIRVSGDVADVHYFPRHGHPGFRCLRGGGPPMQWTETRREPRPSLGLAGLRGAVYGQTTPPVTGVEVVGEVNADYAINVQLDCRDDSLWFGPELLELIDRAPGNEIVIGNKRLVRSASGEWVEGPSDPA